MVIASDPPVIRASEPQFAGHCHWDPLWRFAEAFLYGQTGYRLAPHEQVHLDVTPGITLETNNLPQTFYLCGGTLDVNM